MIKIRVWSINLYNLQMYNSSVLYPKYILTHYSLITKFTALVFLNIKDIDFNPQ